MKRPATLVAVALLATGCAGGLTTGHHHCPHRDDNNYSPGWDPTDNDRSHYNHGSPDDSDHSSLFRGFRG